MTKKIVSREKNLVKRPKKYDLFIKNERNFVSGEGIILQRYKRQFLIVSFGVLFSYRYKNRDFARENVSNTYIFLYRPKCGLLWDDNDR